MSDVRDAAVEAARAGRERFVRELGEFLAIPSVSTDPQHARDVRSAAEWAAERLRSLGFEDVRVASTPGHPVVVGCLTVDRAAPTVLVYGHYDVQPVDPVELWRSPPFEATVSGDNLYCRGATDMKGQMLAVLDAVDALQQAGGCPVNVRALFEGEEEIGSPHLAAFVAKNKDTLQADLCLNPDTGMLAPGVPTVTYSLRGLAYFEIRVEGPSHDLHSGEFGGVIENPAAVLARLVAGMHDGRGRITLPGFYDPVRSLDDVERAELARLPISEDDYREQSGAPALWGEEGYTAIERIGARPTLEVNGLLSGFTGEGSKTVLPAWAMAKLSMRLVADQDPGTVGRQLRAYLAQAAPPTVRWTVEDLASARPSLTERDSSGVRAMSRAMESAWGRAPVFSRGGGTIAVVGDLQKELGLDSVLIGFSLPDDQMHAPNEKLHLPTWGKGIETVVNFFCNLGG